jgi:rod shape-determining protein MreC
MRSLLRFILRYHLFFIFLLMEGLSFTILIQYNRFHRAGFLNITRNIQGFTYTRLGNLKDYFYLRKINQDLANENNLLLNQLDHYKQLMVNYPVGVADSLPGRKYVYIPAMVINNSVNKQYNFITINKGSHHGIYPEMAVISPNGVVGVVFTVSGNFSTIISLLNRDFRISAKIKKNDYFGSLSWKGTDHFTADLSEIPYHVDVQVGDTIVTSGYSAIFPENILLGVISDFSIEESNFYQIEVKLSVDFKHLVSVNVIRNLLRDEQIFLEEPERND